MKSPSFTSWYRVILSLVVVALLFNSCQKRDPYPPKTGDESPDIVYAWYRFIAIVQQRSSPQPVVLAANRAFGCIGVGLYEAVRPGVKGAVSFSTKLYQMPPMPTVQPGREYHWQAVANAALASMFKQFLVNLTDADKVRIDSMETANNNRFKLGTSDMVLSNSQAFGRAIATAINSWTATDNFNLGSQGFVLPVFPGSYELTPPNFGAPVGPYLKDSRPFLEYTIKTTYPPHPFTYSEDKASNFYKDAFEVYTIGNTLTTERKAIADWWADVGGVGVGIPAPYHALSIQTGVLEKQKLTLGQAAEYYAKMGIAMKDGPIFTFRAKFQYNLLRPITYIRKQIDPAWSSYLVAPPYPDYPSGLVGIYAPLVQVMIRAFGNIPVTDDTYSWRGVPPRQYASLSQMLEEAALSRLYAGIHFRTTQNMSIEVGRQLGNRIADINLMGGYKY